MSSGDFLLHLHQGLQHLNNREYSAAMVELEAAVKIRPNHSGALFELGRLYVLQVKPQAAEACLTKVVQQNPEHLEARKFLGLAYIHQQKFSSAEQHLREVTRQSKEDADAWAMFALSQLGKNTITRYTTCAVNQKNYGQSQSYPTMFWACCIAR